MLQFRSTFAAVPAALLAALLAALWALQAPLAAQTPDRPPTVAEASRQAVQAAQDASLRPGDALEILIWREEELSGKFIVDEDGVVTLPMLGRISVEGVPIRELRQRLIADFQVELRNPSITITPLRRVYVLGEVNEPGLLTVDPTVTLAGAVAMAGGANPSGDLGRLRIMRDGVVLFDDVGPEVDLVSIDVRSGDQIFVERRGWFDRNSAFLVSATVGIAGIIVTLLR